MSEHPAKLVNLFPGSGIRVARYWFVDGTGSYQFGEAHLGDLRLAFQIFFLFVREADECNAIHPWFGFFHNCSLPLV